MKTTSQWCLADAQELVSSLWEDVYRAGFILSLSGGVLYRGESDKDLDLFVCQTTKEPHPEPDIDTVLRAFEQQGFNVIWVTRNVPHRTIWKLSNHEDQLIDLCEILECT